MALRIGSTIDGYNQELIKTIEENFLAFCKQYIKGATFKLLTYKVPLATYEVFKLETGKLTTDDEKNIKTAFPGCQVRSDQVLVPRNLDFQPTPQTINNHVYILILSLFALTCIYVFL